MSGTAASNGGPRRTLYRGARLIDPATGRDGTGDLLTENGVIAAVGPGIAAQVGSGTETVDTGGLVLAPGLVDMRVAVGEPGNEHRETIATAAAAASAGGITSMAVLPNTDPPIDSEAGLALIARRARAVKQAKVYAYACLTRGAEGRDLAEIGMLAAAGAVAFTDGYTATADALVMARGLSYAAGHGCLVVQHPEEPRLADGGQMNAGELATRLGLPGIPPLAEAMMIERDLRLVEITGARYHVAHVSTAEAVRVIAAAKRRGLAVTCDTAPPYFTLTETDVGDYRTFGKLSPPLRGELDRRAIVDGLADGTIDVLASDHNPQDQDSKRQPFAHAAPGMVGLETLLPLSLEPYHQGRMALIDVLAALTFRPARLLGIPAGTLAEGAAADLVLIDPEAPWRISVADFRSKSKNSLFDERPVMGRVVRTVVDGRCVFAAEMAQAR